MEKLSSDDLTLIDDLFKKVFCDVIEGLRKIKAEHPEEWAECEKEALEYWATAWPVIEKDPSFISRRYYGKRKAEAVNNGKVYPETKTD